MNIDTSYGKSIEEINYWCENRLSFKDLYRSEQKFFRPVVEKVKTVLDVGCAAGGSYLICKELNETKFKCKTTYKRKHARVKP